MRRYNSTRLLWFVIINTTLIWIVILFMSYDSEVTSVETGSLRVDQAKGKRNTHCDHLRYIVLYHDVDVEVLGECLGLPPTDLQEILIYEGL